MSLSFPGLHCPHSAHSELWPHSLPQAGVHGIQDVFRSPVCIGSPVLQKYWDKSPLKREGSKLLTEMPGSSWPHPPLQATAYCRSRPEATSVGAAAVDTKKRSLDLSTTLQDTRSCFLLHTYSGALDWLGPTLGLQRHQGNAAFKVFRSVWCREAQED